ncbi:MAG: hypothetical protein KJ047_09335 [Anaerolineae bacterium]|nr:hypothetical protein [Anaerolineae bacterium]
MHFENYWIPQNSRYPRCVDGRPVAAILERVGDRWVVTQRGPEAWRDLGPQFPGATLLFVHALEELAGLPREQAFEMAERASLRAGLKCAFHLDDNLGEYRADHLDDEALVALASRYQRGCGYAQVVWGDGIDTVIGLARGRGWRLYIVAGPHFERGATINRRHGTTFDASHAASDGAGHFNLDISEARAVFDHLETLLGQRGFAVRAQTWLEESFRAVITQLGGVDAPEDVRERL